MIKFIREHTKTGKSTYNMSPLDDAQYGRIKRLFQKIKEEGRRVLYEDSTFPATFSVVIEVDYVGDRWCKGYTTYYRLGEEVKVPYTIHYSDVLCAGKPNSPLSGVKIIQEGENPFDK